MAFQDIQFYSSMEWFKKKNFTREEFKFKREKENMNKTKKQLMYWNQKTEEQQYYCSKYGYLFHNSDELKDFSNNSDYFSLDSEI